MAANGVIELIPTQKGHDFLWLDNRKFVYNSADRDVDVWYWRCSQRQNPMINCRAILHTNPGGTAVIRLSNGGHHHLCVPIPEEKEKDRAIQKIKEVASASLEKTAVLIMRVDSHLSPDAALQFPLEGAASRMVNRKRKKAFGGANLGRVNLGTLRMTRRMVRHPADRNQTCLLIDTGRDDPERMIVFGTEASLNLLVENSVWHSDGTYKACPSVGSKQVYSIHARIAGSKVVIAVVALLIAHTREQYVRLFTELLRLEPQLNPTRVLTDFEIAAQQAYQQCWPNVTHTYCFFHLLHSEWRQIQQQHLAVDYMADEELALHAKMLPALAFVPTANVVRAFNDLLAHDRFREQLMGNVGLIHVARYFEVNYIGVQNPQNVGAIMNLPQFPIPMWNCYTRTIDGMPRTNNHVEAFHSALNGNIPSAHPPMQDFIEHIKWVIVHKGNELRRLVRRPLFPPPPKNVVYRQLNARITQFVRRYNEFPNHYEYVRTLAHHFDLVTPARL